ncbi:52 kDa repressor of the inhibitor of the protein kinase [Exaiptasia diaphana]|nr:52 kDa repressor of the inhibitor of the protein kinase [Exaiptasia diaphana]
MSSGKQTSLFSYFKEKRSAEHDEENQVQVSEHEPPPKRKTLDCETSEEAACVFEDKDATSSSDKDNFAGPLKPGAVEALSDHEKYVLLTKNFTPGEKFVFPKTNKYGRNRSFQLSWLKEYSWLVYCPSEDGGLCRVCMLFSSNSNTGVLANSVMNKLHKAKEILRGHEKTKYHNDALIKVENFLKTMCCPARSISSMIDSAKIAQIEYNSHREDNNEECAGKNRGNFLSLLKFRVEAGDEIIDEIPSHASFFTILADEASDVSNTEQLSLSIRFVDENCNIHEEFLGFLSCERTTGEALAKLIYEHWSLDIKNCRGQGYDGTACMPSSLRGTQAFIKEKSSKAVFTHCNAHCLNLVIVHSCEIQMIRNMIGTLNEICLFFKYSPKRNLLLQAVINNVRPETRRSNLISLCKTRWVERHEAFEVFYSLYKAVVKTVEVITNERLYAEDYGTWQWDQETRTKANGFLTAITQFQFIVTMITERMLMFYQPYLRHRDNVPAFTPLQYYQRSLCIPLMDHLIVYMNNYFIAEQINVSKLMVLIPEVLLNTKETLDESIEFYQEDLVSPDIIDVELARWKNKWSNVEE